MNWIRNNQKTALIVGLTVALPAIMVLKLWFELAMLRSQHQGDIERLEPRIARLAGLIESESQLSSSSDQVGAEISRLIYSGDTDQAAVAADLQKNIRELFAATGLSITNSRILPGQKNDNFEHVGLSLIVTGELAALDEALEQIASFSPLLLVESLDVRPNRAARRATDTAAQTITASFKLLSLRATI